VASIKILIIVYIGTCYFCAMLFSRERTVNNKKVITPVKTLLPPNKYSCVMQLLQNTTSLVEEVGEEKF